MSRVFPMPGSPVRRTSWARPFSLVRQSRQARPLGRASDERGTAHSSGLTLRGRGFPLLWQQRLVGIARRRRRLNAQLALQCRRAHVVHPKRPRPVTACVVQPHEEPVRLLAQRVVPQEPLGVQDRPVMVAVLLKKLGEPSRASR
jgi:hypothetical protein